MKGCKSVLVNCQECGEEVRKTLLKMHMKFYHPKIQDPKPSRATKRAGTIFASAGQDFSTWEGQGPNIMQQSPPVVEKILSTAPSAVGAWINTEKQCRVDPLFANVKVSPLPHTIPPKAAYSLPKKSLTTLSNSTYHTPLFPQPMVVSPYAARAKQAVALPVDVKKALPPAQCVNQVMRKPPTPLLPAPTLGNSVRPVGVKSHMKIKDSLNQNIVEADGRMAVGAYGESENNSVVLPLNDELTQDHENSSVAERTKQMTKCRLCGENVPADPQFLQLHEELYHFQVELSGCLYHTGCFF